LSRRQWCLWWGLRSRRVIPSGARDDTYGRGRSGRSARSWCIGTPLRRSCRTREGRPHRRKGATDASGYPDAPDCPSAL